MKYQILSPLTQKQISEKSSQSTLKFIGIGTISKLKLLIPPLPEQQKIASILSKVDEQIEQTEQIIEKTELLKKGLMQKLLTKGIGHTKFKKTELGEIPEEWKIVKFGTCIQQIKDTTLPENENKIVYVGLEHINSGETWLSNYGVSDSVKSLKFKFTKNSILYGKLRPYLDKAVLANIEGICSTDIIVIENKASSIKEFVLYTLHSKNFIDYINSNTAGSNLPRTSWQSVSKYKFAFPPLDEQQKIAYILSKVDSHIKDNQSYLHKLQELKKGLMQDLLTGKVRVCV